MWTLFLVIVGCALLGLKEVTCDTVTLDSRSMDGAVATLDAQNTWFQENVNRLKDEMYDLAEMACDELE